LMLLLQPQRHEGTETYSFHNHANPDEFFCFGYRTD